MDEKAQLFGGWAWGKRQGRSGEDGKKEGQRQAEQCGPRWAHPCPWDSGKYSPARAAGCLPGRPLRCPVWGPQDQTPTWVCGSHCPPPGLMGTLTVLQAVLHHVPIDAAGPDPVWGPPLEGGGRVCHILHCQVPGFTRGCCKDPGKGEMGVHEGSAVSREGQGSELESLVKRDHDGGPEVVEQGHVIKGH